VTIGVPVVAKELRAVRVPVQVSPTQVAYVTDLQWVDTPDRLFQGLLAETVRRTTGRVVLDSQQATLDPGLVVSGQLQRFGYDQASGEVIVRYDAAKSAAGGARVDTRRFEARAPATGDAATVGPALNQAANRVALEVAGWIGG
jgi:cholesterol transport system auxiliary component